MRTDMNKYKSLGWSWNVPVVHIQRKTATDLRTSPIKLRPIWPATSKRTRFRFFKALSCSPSNDLCSSFLFLECSSARVWAAIPMEVSAWTFCSARLWRAWLSSSDIAIGPRHSFDASQFWLWEHNGRMWQEGRHHQEPDNVIYLKQNPSGNAASLHELFKAIVRFAVVLVS